MPAPEQPEWECYLEGSHRYEHSQPEAELPATTQLQTKPEALGATHLTAAQLFDECKKWIDAQRRGSWDPLDMAP